jgi:predicted RNase H-like HicB family nuclease
MTCVIERVETGYRAFIQELPFCESASRTVENAVRGVREALCRYFQEDPMAIPLTFESRSSWFVIQASCPVDVSRGPI